MAVEEEENTEESHDSGGDVTRMEGHRCTIKEGNKKKERSKVKQEQDKYGGQKM